MREVPGAVPEARQASASGLTPQALLMRGRAPVTADWAARADQRADARRTLNSELPEEILLEIFELLGRAGSGGRPPHTSGAAGVSSLLPARSASRQFKRLVDDTILKHDDLRSSLNGPFNRVLQKKVGHLRRGRLSIDEIISRNKSSIMPALEPAIRKMFFILSMEQPFLLNRIKSWPYNDHQRDMYLFGEAKTISGLDDGAAALAYCDVAVRRNDRKIRSSFPYYYSLEDPRDVGRLTGNSSMPHRRSAAATILPAHLYRHVIYAAMETMADIAPQQATNAANFFTIPMTDLPMRRTTHPSTRLKADVLCRSRAIDRGDDAGFDEIAENLKDLVFSDAMHAKVMADPKATSIDVTRLSEIADSILPAGDKGRLDRLVDQGMATLLLSKTRSARAAHDEVGPARLENSLAMALERAMFEDVAGTRGEVDWTNTASLIERVDRVSSLVDDGALSGLGMGRDALEADLLERGVVSLVTLEQMSVGDALGHHGEALSDEARRRIAQPASAG